jgi:hypothetical protein
VPGIEELSNEPSNETECLLPRSRSCTSLTPSMTKASGLGMYYQFPCRGAGCNNVPPYCRLCVKDRSKVIAAYPDCPACVT